MSESGPPPETRGDTAVGEVGTSLGTIDLYRLYNTVRYMYALILNIRCGYLSCNLASAT